MWRLDTVYAPWCLTMACAHILRALDTYSKTGQMPDIDALIKDREEELINAAKALGVNDVRFLSHDDDITVPDKQIINEIADVIGDIRPDIIITHWPYDSVPAYANATQMTLLAMDAPGGIRRGKSYRPHKGRPSVLPCMAWSD